MNDKVQEEIRKVYDFHRKRKAPGIPLGVLMVDMAYELLDGLYPARDSYTLNALCETRVCLPDAVQVLTGCTYANKYLRLDAAGNGRYALVLYNRETSIGFRVFVDVGRIDGAKYPYLKSFFEKTRDYNLKTRDEYSSETLREIYSAGRAILSWRKVKVNLPAKDDLALAAICRACGESFLVQPGCVPPEKCPYCVSVDAGDAVFTILE